MNDAEASHAAAPGLPNLLLGTAPDSWGIWFPDDPQQVPWQRFLDEAAMAGYTLVELGPFGYLPTSAPRLSDELGQRGLTLAGGATGTHLHRGGDSLAEAIAAARPVAALLAEMNAPHLITLPAMYTGLHGGELLEPVELTAAQWTGLYQGHSELGRVLLEEYGVRQMFHPHADAHIQHEDQIRRFLEHTDPQTVSLCLDTGHVAYASGDNRAIVARHADRIGYVHLKSVNPDVMTRVRDEEMPFAEAVRSGAMTEPPMGEPDMPPLLKDLNAIGIPLPAIVEHDMYPAPADAPLLIAARTCRYYSDQGLGGPSVRATGPATTVPARGQAFSASTVSHRGAT